MTSRPDQALLPTGMQDGLPPQAASEAKIAEFLMAEFSRWGYARVKPPLLEFEENLLCGTGKAVANQAFRVQDPISRRMLALRPDMTLQVARIAGSRLSKSPRPLRLAYAGQVARVQSSQLRPERQFGQVGIELIGATGPEADVEVVLMIAESLENANVNDLSIDLGLPTLCGVLIQDLNLDADAKGALKTALDRKDAAGIQALSGVLGSKIQETLVLMLGVLGPVQTAMDKLNAIDLPDSAKPLRAHLNAVVEGIVQARPDLNVTLDPVESRGFEYHTGVTFSVFSRSARGELGRGGRYEGGRYEAGPTKTGCESATGLTLFMDTVMQAIGPMADEPCVFLPYGTSAAQAQKLRKEGWRTMAALEELNNVEDQARHLGCTHVWQHDTVTALN